MTTQKTVSQPVANNPNYDAIQVPMLNSGHVSTHTVTSTVSTHECNASTDYVLIQVLDGDGILVGNGDEPSDANMIKLHAPADHYFGLPDGMKTISWKAIGASSTVKVLEMR